MTAPVVLTQDELQARHGSFLVDLHGLRLLSLAEMEAGAGYDNVEDYEEADEVADDWQYEGFSLDGYSSLTHLSLCRVRGDLTAGHERMPALPAGLWELTLDSGTPAPPVDGHGGAEHRPRDLELRHLTALTRLTLVSLTSALVNEELLGYPYDSGAGPPRFPPRLRVLSLREPASDGGSASRISLRYVLSTVRAVPPPAHLPVLHVKTDEVRCCPSDLWPQLSDIALPESLHVQTRRLTMSLFRALRSAGREVFFLRMGRLTPAEISSVRPAEALCQLLRSMPACVKEFGLGCPDRQSLCLRLEWYVYSAAPAKTYHHEVSYTTAADLAASLQQLASEYGLRSPDHGGQ